MKGLAESSPFHLLTNPHMINRFIFGHGVVIYYKLFHLHNGLVSKDSDIMGLTCIINSPKKRKYIYIPAINFIKKLLNELYKFLICKIEKAIFYDMISEEGLS